MIVWGGGVSVEFEFAGFFLVVGIYFFLGIGGASVLNFPLLFLCGVCRETNLPLSASRSGVFPAFVPGNTGCPVGFGLTGLSAGATPATAGRFGCEGVSGMPD